MVEDYQKRMQKQQWQWKIMELETQLLDTKTPIEFQTIQLKIEYLRNRLKELEGMPEK